MYNKNFKYTALQNQIYNQCTYTKNLVFRLQGIGTPIIAKSEVKNIKWVLVGSLK